MIWPIPILPPSATGLERVYAIVTIIIFVLCQIDVVLVLVPAYGVYCDRYGKAGTFTSVNTYSKAGTFTSVSNYGLDIGDEGAFRSAIGDKATLILTST
jgi:hypothetical protein